MNAAHLVIFIISGQLTGPRNKSKSTFLYLFISRETLVLQIGLYIFMLLPVNTKLNKQFRAFFIVLLAPKS